MAKELNPGLMALVMKATTSRAKKKAVVGSRSQMAAIMRDSSSTTKLLGTGTTTGQTARPTKANGLAIKWTAWEFSSGKTANTTRVTLRTTSEMAKARLFGQMVDSTSESGRTANNTDWEPT